MNLNQSLKNEFTFGTLWVWFKGVYPSIRILNFIKSINGSSFYLK